MASRRLVIQATSLESRIQLRSIHSSASTCNNVKPNVQPIQSTKATQKKDNLLRKAIELYHLTPHFLPSPQTVTLSNAATADSKPMTWDSALDNVIYSSILNTNSLSKSTPSITSRSLTEFARDQSMLASSIGSGWFDRSNEQAQKRAEGRTQWASDITSTTFQIQQERRAAASNNRAFDSLNGEFSDTTESSAAPEMFSEQDIDTYQRRHSHATGSATDHPGIERLANLERITPGSTGWYRYQGLDPRTARIRDAIFGTVSGELPGLEVVRERVAKMKNKKPPVEQ